MQQKWLPILLLLPLALTAQRTYDCGNLNQRSCKSNDWEYINMQLGRSRGCEPDLKNVDGYCRNENRNTTLIRNPFWAGWANENQLLSIGQDTPINFITWPAAHNSYSNSRQGFNSILYTNHVLSITDQLNFGFRHLELDPKYFNQFAFIPYPPLFLPIPTPLGEAAIRLCHGSDVAMCNGTGYGNRLFGFALKEIADWVDANPGQVLYLKIDNIDLDSHMQEMFTEVETVLGNRLYPLPANMTRWPTLREVRNAGKSILVAYHNRSTTTATSRYVYNAAGLMQADNHPKDQNFTTCVAYDGLNPTERSVAKPLSWWDTAEGRAITNDGNSATGLYWQNTVEQATNCGVSTIGLDFINALDSDYNISKSDDADLRINRMIWSWAENDYGQRGPAFQDPTAGRWVSNAPTLALPIACAYRGGLQDRQWRITSAAITWSKPLGDAQCRAEFGQNYEFAFPTNGWQNQKLREAASGRKIWLGYTLGPVDTISLSTNSHVFRMSPGGALPAALQVRVAAAPGTLLEGKLTGNIPFSFSIPANALASGDFTFPITVTSSLPSGIYDGTLDLSYRVPYSQNSKPISIRLQLVVRATPTLSATPGATTIRQGLPITLTALLNNAFSPTGTIKFYRMPGEETVAAANVANSGVKPEITTLPLGTNTYIASYSGDKNNLAAESEPFTVTVTPRLVPTPAVLTINGLDTNVRTIQVANLGTNPQVTASCNWLKAGFDGSSVSVRVQGEALNYGVGSYSCLLYIRDSQPGQTTVPVVLNVQTTMSATPAAVTGSTLVTINAGSSIRVEATSNHPGVVVDFPNGNATPATLRITVNPATAANAQILVTSPHAPSIAIPVTLIR